MLLLPGSFMAPLVPAGLPAPGLLPAPPGAAGRGRGASEGLGLLTAGDQNDFWT